MIIRKSIQICIILILITACTDTVSQTITEPVISPSAIPSKTQTAQPTSTPIPATATSTIQPISGLANWQINVRSGPGIYYSLLGEINKGERVQIIGVDPSNKWLAILFENDSDGQAWVSNEYVQSTELINLPILGLVTLFNGPPAPQANLAQKLNVRNGPGTHYDSLGLIPANTIIWLLGRNEDSSWYMIDYPSTQGGNGWVISGYVTTQDNMALPILDSSGNPMTEIPANQPVLTLGPPTPIYSIALSDDDSFENPSVSVEFSPLKSRQFSFSSDLSQPEGDRLDWIEFKPYGSYQNELITVSTSLICNGNGTIRLELFQADKQVFDWGNLDCGDSDKTISLSAGINYIFQLEIVGNDESSYLDYIISIITVLN